MKKNWEFTRRIVICVCMICGLIVVLASYFYTTTDNVRFTWIQPDEYKENWEIKLSDTEFAPITLPAHPDVTPGDTIVIRNYLPDDLKDNSELFFRSSHKRVLVQIDGEPVYSFGKNDKTLFYDSPGSAWLVVPLDSSMAGSEITIELETIETTFYDLVNTVYLAPSNTAGLFVVLQRLPNLLLCLITIFVGALLMLTGCLLRRLDMSKSLLRLGVLAIYMGIWESFGTKATQFLFGDMIHIHIVEFYLFTMISPLFLWFFLSLEHYKNNRLIRYMFCFSIFIFFSIEILAITKVASYDRTMIVSHVYIFLFSLYVFIEAVVSAIRERKHNRRILHLLSISVFLVFSTIDLVRLYLPGINKDETLFTKYGMLIFISLWTGSLLSQASVVYKEAAQAEVLKKLAYEDYMTKLKNRTAFEKALDNINALRKETTFLLFDLNNMKQINDEFGHSVGDQVLIIIASVLKEVFEPEGVCYRIGGDEMCVLTGELPDEDMKKKIEQVRQLIDEAVKETGVNFSIAVGYARTKYSEGIGSSSAFNKADHLMYQCKKEMKTQA